MIPQSRTIIFLATRFISVSYSFDAGINIGLAEMARVFFLGGSAAI